MKNRIFVVVVCIAFLAVMVGLSFANSGRGAESYVAGSSVAEPDGHICEPMTKGFWKRLCKKGHPAKTLFDVDVADERCDALEEKTKGDPCLRADSQLAALEFNLEYGILFESCEGFDEFGEPATVGDVLDEIDSLLGGVPETCKEIAELADGINSRDFFEDPYLVTNLYDLEQNTFYKDIYAKISNWLNDFLKSS